MMTSPMVSEADDIRRVGNETLLELYFKGHGHDGKNKAR